MARTKPKHAKPAPAVAEPRHERAWIPWLAPLLITAAAASLSLIQIDLTIIDLGRHLKNGEIALTGTPAQRDALLHTNFYSYAHGSAPFVNHHWLSGVVFYLVWKLASFEGLSLLHAAVTALAVLIAYLAALKSSHWTIAAPLMALALPNIVWRAEVRPEAFTNLLIAVFLLILLAWFHGRLRTRWLFAALPALTALWVNLHIGFIFAFLVLGMFGLKLLPDRARLKQIVLVFAACLVAGLANPSGVRGLLQPLNIFGNFEFGVAETRPLAAVWRSGQWSWHYTLLASLMALAVAVAAWRWRHRRRFSTTRWPELLLLLAAAALTLAIIRNMPTFCLLAAPLLAGTVADAVRPPRWLALGVCALGATCAFVQFSERSARAGPGLLPGVNGTAEFLRRNGVQGPVWNDALIGSYLIFHRFDPRDPSSGVFADMRPEAYGAFLADPYQKMLTDPETWRRIDDQYRFRALVFSLQDPGAGIEESILARVRDPEWAPVYTDSYSLVFVRRIPEHAAMIERHLIPREVFR
jgi:hypothetical protein